MSHDAFWARVDAQLKDLQFASSADEVIELLGGAAGASAGDAFFEGGGGDGAVAESLSTAGWSYVWYEAPYYWCMCAENGDMVTYVEGDVYRGNTKAAS